MAAERKAVVVGISGCSSSGKTTLARLLRDIFPRSFILHEDDFYKPDEEIPVKDGLADWDCPEAISLPAMVQALEYIRANGVLPPDLFSKEDQNAVGACPVPDAAIAALKAKVAAWAAEPQRAASTTRICFLDGFLLYTPDMRAAMDLIDVRLFLRVSQRRATQRREARNGYVTLDGFWQDPPGYMDKVVWPNYVATHAWLFPGGDVEAEPDAALLASNSILTQRGAGLDVDMETTLTWAVDTLMATLGNGQRAAQ